METSLLVDFYPLWHTTCISLMVMTRGLLCGVGQHIYRTRVRFCVGTGCAVVETRVLPVSCCHGIWLTSQTRALEISEVLANR